MGLTWLWVIATLVVVGAEAERGGSSLRGALEALQRRQRGHMHGPIIPQPDYDALYEFVPPPGYPVSDYVDDGEGFEDGPNPRYVVKLLEENERPPEAYEYKVINKKKSHFDEQLSNKQESPFRERVHHSANDQLRDLFMDKAEVTEKKELDATDKDAEYALLLGQLWTKYKYNKDHANNIKSTPQGVVKLYKEKAVKKWYPDNWGPIAFKKKRSSDSDIDGPILRDYEERKQDSGPSDPYELNDDDKDNLREEYAIAFQPLDDDALSDLADDDQYTYDAFEKRFPVTKRSSVRNDLPTKKRNINQKKRDAVKAYRSSSGTDPRIIQDLSKIFGNTNEMIRNPVKRSSNLENMHHDSKPPMIPLLNHDNNTDDQAPKTTQEDENNNEYHGQSIHHPGISAKEIEVDPEQTHTLEHDYDDRKTKHEHGKIFNSQSLKVADTNIILKKKSIDWSDYFGIDKRATEMQSNYDESDVPLDRLRDKYFEELNKNVMARLEEMYGHGDARKYFMKLPIEKQHEIARSIASYYTKRSTGDKNSKMDNIDKNIKNMEGLIVGEALHLSSTGEELDSKEEQEMKEKLLSRLAAAYSLEKMRKALKEFKQSLQTQKSEAHGSVAPNSAEKPVTKKVMETTMELKKEMSSKSQEKNDDFEDEQGAGHYVDGKAEEQLSEGYMGGSGMLRVPRVVTVESDGSCPILAKIVQRCRAIERLAGGHGHLFLTICSLHQICYLCDETPVTTCDLMFLSEADSECEGNKKCQRAARSTLSKLQIFHDNLTDQLEGECEASPCLRELLKLGGWHRPPQR